LSIRTSERLDKQLPTTRQSNDPAIKRLGESNEIGDYRKVIEEHIERRGL